MRHGVAGRKFSRYSEHRMLMLINLAKCIILYKRITTTLAKAKSVRPLIEKLITRAKDVINVTKQESFTTTKLPRDKQLLILHLKRELMKSLGTMALVNKLIEEVATKCINRPGGYTRIIRNGFQRGDQAELARLSLVDFDHIHNQSINAPAPSVVASVTN